MPPVMADARNRGAALASTPRADARSPAPSVAPEATTRRHRHAATPWAASGSSCSSHIRMPVSPIASTRVDVVSLAASYFTCSRCPMRSAEMASTPLIGLSRRSRITTSSLQSMPSTRKTASAWSSHTVQVTTSATMVLLDVAKPLAEQREHVLVVERVINQPSVTPGADDAGVAQEPQLMRDRRLGHPEQGGEVTDTLFAS